VIMTIGHSTRTAAEFLSLLRTHGVTGIADVRTVPRSRRHPHFSRDALSVFLPEHGIAYIHVPGLGGLRKPAKDSVNSGWRVEGFRGYADHMQSGEFRAGLETLLAFADTHQAAVMCAESKWWQCHRQLIADALVTRGIDVRHILSAGDPAAHQLTPFARANGAQVTYPGLI
jgi:uncharacterized protein (DUF488 family)